MDRLAICRAAADSRVADSRGHPVSSRRYVNEGCQSVSRGVGSPTQSRRHSSLGTQGRATAHVNGQYDQLAVDEKVIRINGDDYWLYGAVDPETNEILHFRLFPTVTKQTTRWFLTELHRRYRFDNVEFLVDDADYLVNVLDEDGSRFQMLPHGNLNAIERIFWEIERRTSSFATSFNHVEPQTAESWLQALAVRHNSRQS